MQTSLPVRRQSLLQKIKSEERSASLTTGKFMPSSYDRLKELQSRKQALNFMNEMVNNRIKNKNEFCKQQHISHHTLNKALESLGVSKKRSSRKTNIGHNDSESQSKPRIAKGLKSNRREKSRDVIAGSQKENELADFSDDILLDDDIQSAKQTFSLNIPSEDDERERLKMIDQNYRKYGGKSRTYTMGDLKE